MNWRKLFGTAPVQAAHPPHPLPKPKHLVWLGSFLVTRGLIKGCRQIRFTVADDRAEAIKTIRGELLKVWDSVRVENCQLVLKRADDYQRVALRRWLPTLLRERYCVFVLPSHWRTGRSLEDIVRAVAVD